MRNKYRDIRLEEERNDERDTEKNAQQFKCRTGINITTTARDGRRHTRECTRKRMIKTMLHNHRHEMPNDRNPYFGTVRLMEMCLNYVISYIRQYSNMIRYFIAFNGCTVFAAGVFVHICPRLCRFALSLPHTLAVPIIVFFSALHISRIRFAHINVYPRNARFSFFFQHLLWIN